MHDQRKDCTKEERWKSIAMNLKKKWQKQQQIDIDEKIMIHSDGARWIGATYIVMHERDQCTE